MVESPGRSPFVLRSYECHGAHAGMGSGSVGGTLLLPQLPTHALRPNTIASLTPVPPVAARVAPADAMGKPQTLNPKL